MQLYSPPRLQESLKQLILEDQTQWVSKPSSAAGSVNHKPFKCIDYFYVQPKISEHLEITSPIFYTCGLKVSVTNTEAAVTHSQSSRKSVYLWYSSPNLSTLFRLSTICFEIRVCFPISTFMIQTLCFLKAECKSFQHVKINPISARRFTPVSAIATTCDCVLWYTTPALPPNKSLNAHRVG